MIDNKMSSRNVLSDEAHEVELLKPFVPEEFVMDLQLFGKGGGDGKSGGKMLMGVAGFFLGGAFWGALGATSWLGGAVMGAALLSSVWTAFHRPDMPDYDNIPDIQRFDKTQETMSSTASIPIVYGERKIAGNQTFHETFAEQTQLHKHVVLCEGGIQGLKSVTAAGLLIPTGSQTANTVFTIQNTKHPDAQVSLRDKKLRLVANGVDKTIDLKSKADLEANPDKADTYWEYQVSTPALISFINRMGNGWEAFPTANTTKYPGDLRICFPQSDDKLHELVVYDKTYKKGDPFRKEGDKFTMDGVIYTVVEFLNRKSGSEPLPYYRVTRQITGTNASVYMRPANVEADTVSGGTKYTFHDCQVPKNYSDVGGYPQMAWLDMTFYSSSELNGNPNVEAVVQGKKVYDPRDGKTKYSTNPVLCTLDFLTSKRYGLGRWISREDLEMNSFIAAANYCDETVVFRDNNDDTMITTKRYELNMVIDQRQDAITWLQNILANFSGYLVYSKGKLKMCVEQKTPISYRFDDSNITDLKIVPLKAEDQPNDYHVSIIDPRNNWKTIKCKVSDYSDQKMRGKIIVKDVQLDGTTSQYQALRLARFYRDYNLTCPIQLSFTTGTQGMHLEPGDVITLTYRDVFKDLPIRILQIAETEKNTFEISGRQYNPSLYNDDLGGGVQWHKYTVNRGLKGGSDYAGTPDMVENVMAYTNDQDELLIEHDVSLDPNFKEYRYYVEEVRENDLE